jgi:predicted MPP superfamily phosphohydrolase
VRIDGKIDPAPRAGWRLLCTHHPGDFPAAAAAGYGLVLAGHLHGGQCVLATRRGRLYPAAWIYRWHGLRFAEWGAVLLVSRGAGDTLPVRFNCPREVILCMIT